MTDNLVIDTGVVRLTINGDAERVIEFYPNDVTFVERWQALYGELIATMEEYEKRAKDLDKTVALDDNGIPVNASDRIAYMREVCEFMRLKIDSLFGNGTSKTAFGDALNLEMFEQFLKGVTPYITAGRAERIERYSNPVAEKKHKHRV